MSDLKCDSFFDLSTFEHAALFQSCNFVYEAISKIDDYLEGYKNYKIEAEVADGAFLVNRETISLGKGTVVEPGAYIKGPCIIGKNCTIRQGAYIRGLFIAGDHSVIGHDTEVKSSIMLNHAHAAHFAYLGNTIVGNYVNLGAGTKCANLNLNQKEVQILINGNWVLTNLRKLGAIIGDGCQLGCNSVTNPGTILGKNVFCYPGTILKGFIAADSLVRPDIKNVIQKKAIILNE